MKFAARQGNLGTNETDTVRAAKELGFEGAQLGFAMDYQNSQMWYERDAKEVANVAKQEGVEICSICAGTLNRFGFVSEDESVRGLGHLVMEHSLRAAKILDADNVLLPAFGTMKMEDQAGMDRVAGEIHKLLPLAEDLDMVISLECTLNAADTLAVCEAIGSSLVQVYFDMANALFYGHDPLVEARALAPRLAEVHIKDATPEAIVPLGEGNVDVAAVIKALTDSGYDGYYAFETQLKGEKKEALARDLAYVKERV